MALLDLVQAACNRLAPHGWDQLLAAHGIDLTAADLAAELTATKPAIDRSIRGFADFAEEGCRGIEPGDPARSILYHAFASPSVLTTPDGTELTAFPTAAEIEAVENYVYATRLAPLSELLRQGAQSDLGVVVFAVQYRPSLQTPHRRHADLCFARTGIARVGTLPARYDGQRRGFHPTADDPYGIRVLPACYAPYLAIRVPGNVASSIPMRHLVADPPTAEIGDHARLFWVPFHKLFPGPECIRDLDLHVEFRTLHVNEKLRRIHLSLGHDAGWHEPDLSQPPFQFSDGIAELGVDESLAQGTVIPQPHEKLVEAASYQGKPLTFKVPPNTPLSSSFNIAAEGLLRHGPEYVHVRTMVEDDGTETDLNERRDVDSVVAAGGYRARHYVDFTGDGWVSATVPELAVAVPRRRNAYSVIAAPDFFPNTDQRTLSEWVTNRVPPSLSRAVWRIPPTPLADQRFPANLELPAGDFQADEDTVTAVVPLLRAALGHQTASEAGETDRHSHLPDDAAGVFAPGWDVSVDGHRGMPEHLAAYGLGSPFPEDSKLCAALSSFWPAVAPDAARTFEPSALWPTVIPLTDEEIGIVGDLPWDGVPGPRVVEDQQGGRFAEYFSLANTDYVRNALTNRFTLARTAAISDNEYKARVLAMLRVYQALGVDLIGTFSNVVASKARWAVLSFRQVDRSDAEVQQAETEAGAALQLTVYRFEVFLHGTPRSHPHDERKIQVPIRRAVRLLVDPVTVLMQDGSQRWRNAQ